jgi:hypothetical protein
MTPQSIPIPCAIATSTRYHYGENDIPSWKEGKERATAANAVNSSPGMRDHAGDEMDPLTQGPRSLSQSQDRSHPHTPEQLYL